jgi:hypothetical protein
MHRADRKVAEIAEMAALSHPFRLRTEQDHSDRDALFTRRSSAAMDGLP